MHEIKSFKIFQTAKVIAAMYAIFLAIFAALALLISMHGPGRKPPLALILVMPILGGIVSFIVAAFYCWLYNQIAGRIGGIAFELAPRIEP